MKPSDYTMHYSSNWIDDAVLKKTEDKYHEDTIRDIDRG